MITNSLLDLKDFWKHCNTSERWRRSRDGKTYGKFPPHFHRYYFEESNWTAATGRRLVFGERSFDVDDLMRIDSQGRVLFQSFVLPILPKQAKTIFNFHASDAGRNLCYLPRRRRFDKPNQPFYWRSASDSIWINEASQALLNQIETIIKLIRSKVSVSFLLHPRPAGCARPQFCWHSQTSKCAVPLQGIATADRKVIKQTAENYR